MSDDGRRPDPAPLPEARQWPGWVSAIVVIASLAVLIAGVGASAATVTGAASSFSNASESGGIGGSGGDGNGGSGGATSPTPSGDNAGSAGGTASPADSSGTASAATGSAAAAAASAPVPTMLILDASGSMVRDVPGGGTRMEAARAAATALVNGLSDTQPLGLEVFGTGTGNADSDQAAGCSDVKTLVPVGPVDKASFTSTIAGIVQSGFTPIGPALQLAAQQLPADKPATVVLVSDGVDTCAPPSSCDVAKEVRKGHPLLTIEAIGFAVDADESAQEQMTCVAQAGGGSYVDVANAAQLTARLRIASNPQSVAGAITPAGYKGLRVGETLEQAQAAVAGLTVTKTTTEIVYVDCPDAQLEFEGGMLARIIPKTTAPTAEGLAVGSDVANGVALYGAPTAPTSAGGETYVDFPVTPGSVNGYRVYYTPTGGSVQGSITRIIVCTCGPKASAAGSVLANWQIDYTGVGPLKLGETFAAAQQVLPAESNQGIPSYCTWESTLNTGNAGFSLLLTGDPNAAVPTITSISVSVVYGTEVSDAPQTWRNAGLGQTLAQLQAEHPDLTVVKSDKYGTFATVTGANGSSLRFWFARLDSTVTSVEIGVSATPLFDGCA